MRSMGRTHLALVAALCVAAAALVILPVAASLVWAPLAAGYLALRWHGSRYQPGPSWLPLVVMAAALGTAGMAGVLAATSFGLVVDLARRRRDVPLRLVLEAGTRLESLGGLVQGLEELIGSDATVEFQQVERIEPGPTGKHRFVIPYTASP